MSRAPSKSPGPRPAKSGGGSRSFERQRQREMQRQTRRRVSRNPRRSSATLRSMLRRVPTAAWICALIALLNATAWSIITPPFQGRDEVDHYAYVEHLAEKGTLPQEPTGLSTYSPGELGVITALHYGEVRFTSYTPSISSAAQQTQLAHAASSGAALTGPETAGGASSAPPLYYALQTIPFGLGGSNPLIQLQLMRLLSALLGAITVLLIYFFLREALPAVPWAATVGAICVALQPQFAFTTGSVNPDALIYALSAASFLCLARGFRRGLTLRLAVALGLVSAAGLLTYYSYIGIALGTVGALVVVAVRDARSRGRQALAAPALAIGLALSPAVLDALVKAGSGHTFGPASSVAGTIGLSSLWHEISYVWETYLPRLPGMTQYFAGISTWRDIWFDRSVGLYGWMDTMFPSWVDSLALILALPVALLCARELILRRQTIRARLPELGGYAIVALGLLVMLGVSSYSSNAIEHEEALGEPRYLLPLLPLFGAAIVLAIRGAGRRWMPVAGAAMVVLFLGHDLFSQLQAIARYYG
jgi:Predicted membrane protein (DUF2142)